jgi:hypothetical protein
MDGGNGRSEGFCSFLARGIEYRWRSRGLNPIHIRELRFDGAVYEVIVSRRGMKYTDIFERKALAKIVAFR